MTLPSLDHPEITRLLTQLIAAIPTVLLFMVGALALNFMVGRALAVLVRRRLFTEREIHPVRRVLRWGITLIAGVLILGALGFNVGGMWGILSTVLAMVAIGFVAVWSVLSNTLCTLIIMIFRPFAVGDEIEFAGEPVKGRVMDFNMIYTSLDAGDGSVLQIPNNLFFQKVVRRRQMAGAVPVTDHLREKKPASLPVAVSSAPVHGQ